MLATDAAPAGGSSAVLLRRAAIDDLHAADRGAGERLDRFERCRRVFDDGEWPLALIDVEPLLDEGRTVAYYLGPHGLDDVGLREALRRATGLDVRLEPAGLDGPWEEAPKPPEPSCGAGGCGSCGEKTGGGCGGCPVAGRSV